MIFYVEYCNAVGDHSFYKNVHRIYRVSRENPGQHEIIPPEIMKIIKFFNFLCILLAATITTNIRISITFFFFSPKHYCKKKKINSLCYYFRKRYSFHGVFILPTVMTFPRLFSSTSWCSVFFFFLVYRKKRRKKIRLI